MQNKYSILLLTAVIGLTACQENQTAATTDDSKVLATVADYQVTQRYLETYLKSKGVAQADQQQSSQALDEIIKQLSLGHQAKLAGLQLSLEQSLRIEQAKHRSLAQAAIDQYLLERPVTEDDIQAEYQRVTAELKGQEYHVRHMLFQDEVAALTVLEQIPGNSTYLEAEQRYLASLEKPMNVGDIGWVNLMQVPEVFRAPLQSMQAGQVHPIPLQSQFGVHVLYLADKRALVPPDYATVKTGIKQTLERQKIDRYQQLAVIKSKAKVVPQ